LIKTIILITVTAFKVIIVCKLIIEECIFIELCQVSERADRYESTIEELTARIKNVSTSVFCLFFTS